MQTMLSTKHVHAPLDLKLILCIGLAYDNIYSSLLTEYDRQLNRKKIQQQRRYDGIHTLSNAKAETNVRQQNFNN